MIALAGGIAALMAASSVRSTRGWTARRIATAAGALCLSVIALVVAGVQTPPPVAFVEGTMDLARVSGTAAIGLHLITILLMIGALLSGGGAASAALAAYFALAVLGGRLLGLSDAGCRRRPEPPDRLRLGNRMAGRALFEIRSQATLNA